jgi:predicted  nucleic acid-binding Zn-ribbon protein
VTDEVTTPMAGGVLAPFVLLPRAALEWPAARREVVLQHELLHLRGLDPLRALAARCAAAIYWFHPLVWIAGREAVLARESACDEQVVALGTRPSLYASVLLELADASGRTPIPAAVLPMIQRSLLETRLMSILKRDRPGGGRRLTIVAVALMSLVALSVAVAAPQEQDPPKPVKPPKPPVVEPVLAEEPIEPVLAEQSVVPDLPPLPALGKLAPLPPLDAEPMPALAPFAEPMPSELPYGEPMPALAPFAESMPTPGIAATPALAPQASGVWTVPESEPAVAPVPGVWSVPAPRAALAPLPEPPACAWDGSGGLSYNGSMSMTSTGGYRVIEGIGKADGNLMMKKVVDGVTLCLQTRGDVEFTEDMTGIQRIGDGGSVLLATVGEDREQAMEITGTAPTDHQWAIDGQPTPFDEEARVWRDSLLEVLGRFWEISTIRGEVSSLRGEASSLRGHMSSLRGEASALRGEASGLRGKASSLRGERSALQGEISAIRGQLSAMRGEVSSHQGEISALTAERSRASETEFESIEAQIAEHRQAIEILAAEIEEVDVEARVEAVERQIEALEFESRVEEYEAQAEQLQTGERMEQLQEEMEAFQLESELRMQEIQVQIEGLNAEERIGALQQELELHLQQLQLARERTR